VLKSIGKQSGESVLKKKWEAAVGRVCRKGRYATIGHAKVTQVGRLLKVTYHRAAPYQGRSLLSTLLCSACTNKHSSHASVKYEQAALFDEELTCKLLLIRVRLLGSCVRKTASNFEQKLEQASLR